LHVEEIRRRLFGFNFGLGETTGKGRLTHRGEGEGIYIYMNYMNKPSQPKTDASKERVIYFV